MKRLKTFENLKHRDKIISPIDNEVMEFYIAKDGEKYLANDKYIWNYYQFDAKDFYVYTGKKEIGQIDKEYFN